MPSGREEKVLSDGSGTGPYVMIAHETSMSDVTTPSPVEFAVLVNPRYLAVRGRNVNAFVSID